MWIIDIIISIFKFAIKQFFEICKDILGFIMMMKSKKNNENRSDKV